MRTMHQRNNCGLHECTLLWQESATALCPLGFIIERCAGSSFSGSESEDDSEASVRSYSQGVAAQVCCSDPGFGSSVCTGADLIIACCSAWSGCSLLLLCLLGKLHN